MAQLNYTKSNASQDGSQVILNYTPLIYGNLAYNGAFTDASTAPLFKSYLNLGASSGNTHAHYFVTTLQIPQPGDNIGYIRRLLFNLRFTNAANIDAFPLPPSLGVSAPSFVIANLSNGQVYYGGFKPSDFFTYDYNIVGTKPAIVYPYGAIKSGCIPFFASPNDNIELCCIVSSGADTYGVLNVQFANFDLDVWKDTVTNGWADAS